MAEPRRLCTLREITAVQRMKGKYNRYDVVTVGGGWTVVAYHRDFQVGDVVVYFEINAFLPKERCKFSWTQENKMNEYNGEIGYLVRSQMLGTQLSQGLVQRINAIPAIQDLLENIRYTGQGDAIQAVQALNLDEIVGVRKWEVPFEAQTKVIGRAPSFFPRPASRRVQNSAWDLFSTGKYLDTIFQVTEKIDGVSMTFYRVDTGSKWAQSLPELDEDCRQVSWGGRFGVSSAAEDLDTRGGDAYWEAAWSLNLPNRIDQVMAMTGLNNIAIQGELIGPTIKNNSRQFPIDAPHRFVVFQVFDIDGQKFVNPAKVEEVCEKLALPHVPVLGYIRLRDLATSVHEVLLKAEGTATGLEVTREGLILKSMVEFDYVVKVISNKWLLEQGE